MQVINDMEGPGTVNKYVVQNWFKRFKDGNTSLEDKSKPRKGTHCGEVVKVMDCDIIVSELKIQSRY